MKTLVLSGTHSFAFLSGSAESHSFQPLRNCYYEAKQGVWAEGEIYSGTARDFAGH